MEQIEHYKKAGNQTPDLELSVTHIFNATFSKVQNRNAIYFCSLSTPYAHSSNSPAWCVSQVVAEYSGVVTEVLDVARMLYVLDDAICLVCSHWHTVRRGRQLRVGNQIRIHNTHVVPWRPPHSHRHLVCACLHALHISSPSLYRWDFASILDQYFHCQHFMYFIVIRCENFNVSESLQYFPILMCTLSGNREIRLVVL